jgi:AAA domain
MTMDPQPRVNPYIAGSPITGTEMFYGREDVFSFIKRNLTGLHRDTPIVLDGQRRTGKTSVLYQLHRHLDPRYRCVFIDLHGLSLDGMGNLLHGIANSISRSLQRDHQLKVTVPDRASFLADPRSAFESRFLDDVWSALGDDHLVLMVDEAVRLHEEVQAGHLKREIFEFLRHLMQHFTRLNFIFSLGSGLEEMTKDYAFLFSVSLYRRISFLEPTAARELITRPVRGHYEVTAQAVTKILQVTSGHPYYTQLVCHCMFDSWSRAPKPVMDAADVEAVLAEAIELGSANLTYVWEDSAPEEKALMAGVAAAMRHGTGPVIIDNALDAWHELSVRLPQREVARALRSLTSREVLAGDQAYRFSVDLQRLWCEKHRHLDWVKDELTEAIGRWHESTEPWPADTIPVLTSAPGTTDGQKPGKASARTKPPLTRNRYLIIAAAGIIAIAASLAAATHVFTFSNSPQSITPQRITQQGITQSLVKLVPGGVALKPQECHSVAPSNPWTMPGLLLELRCDVPELAGGNVYAYQLDNTTDYNTTWRNFNQWWGFLPARAGTMCPPKGTENGIVTWTTGDLPQASRPVQECGMQTPSRGNTVPAYVWGYPSIGVFILAQGTPGSSFATLHSWVTGQAPKPENLLDIIPADIKQESSCPNAGTAVGAVDIFQCAGLRGAADTIMYYLFASPQLLATGFSNLLHLQANFTKSRECMTNNQFMDFLINCRSDFTSRTPQVTGSIVEYINTDNQPIIVSTDNQQKVMAVMVGTNGQDLLNYWKQLKWVVTGH